MSRSDFAGAALLASFLLWLPAAILPSRVWRAPLAEKLALIREHRRAWEVVALSCAAATVAVVVGFAALADPLEQAGGGAAVPVAYAGLLLAAGLWVASLVFRLTAMPRAAEAAPPGFEAMAWWAGGLFLAWSALGNLALAGFGAAVARSGYPAAWAGWSAVGLAALMLVQLAVTGDALPALYHVGPALIGVALLLD